MNSVEEFEAGVQVAIGSSGSVQTTNGLGNSYLKVAVGRERESRAESSGGSLSHVLRRGAPDIVGGHYLSRGVWRGRSCTRGTLLCDRERAGEEEA